MELFEIRRDLLMLKFMVSWLKFMFSADYGKGEFLRREMSHRRLRFEDENDSQDASPKPPNILNILTISP